LFPNASWSHVSSLLDEHASRIARPAVIATAWSRRWWAHCRHRRRRRRRHHHHRHRHRLRLRLRLRREHSPTCVPSAFRFPFLVAECANDTFLLKRRFFSDSLTDVPRSWSLVGLGKRRCSDAPKIYRMPDDDLNASRIVSRYRRGFMDAW